MNRVRKGRTAAVPRGGPRRRGGKKKEKEQQPRELWGTVLYRHGEGFTRLLALYGKKEPAQKSADAETTRLLAENMYREASEEAQPRPYSAVAAYPASVRGRNLLEESRGEDYHATLNLGTADDCSDRSLDLWPSEEEARAASGGAGRLLLEGSATL